MDRSLLRCIAGSGGETTLPPARRRFSVEIDRRGVFATIGRYDAYLCLEPEAARSLQREPGSFDGQLWRLHLIVSRVP